MKLCSIIVALFAVGYAIALALFFISYLELFGQEADPLSAVFLVLLGQPWVRFLNQSPEQLRPWLIILAPTVNLALLGMICRAFRRH